MATIQQIILVSVGGIHALYLHLEDKTQGRGGGERDGPVPREEGVIDRKRVIDHVAFNGTTIRQHNRVVSKWLFWGGKAGHHP